MSHKPYPSETQDRFIVRFPDGMRDRIAEEAKANGRSMNAEIVQRLEMTLGMTTRPNVPNISGDIPFYMAQDIAMLAEDTGVSFREMLSRIFIAGIHKDAPQVLYVSITPGVTAEEVRKALEATRDIARPDAALVFEPLAKKP
ncbi:Arc family DNA-binding protein [Herminiimonas sp. CN]|uniref:Arc family DNA-binding protein n=1 Tax=Herminiimonas sp. CN TaxID=1349818 RepID=UPI0004742349|nr:Arc family DNA-binding protein [Herminiimonas sp. CN]